MAVRARGRWVLAVAFFGASTTAACSLIFDTDAQCSSTSDCIGRGAAFSDTQCVDSVCVSSVAPIPDATTDTAQADTSMQAPDATDATAFACGLLPPPDLDPSHPLTATLINIDLSAGLPATTIDVRLCASNDAFCMNPRTTVTATDAGGGGTGSGLPDAGPEGGTGWVYPAKDGTIVATVETGFEGYFQIRSANYFPTIRFTSPPLRESENDLEEIMLRPSEIQFFADEATGRTSSYDAVNKGLVFVLARDCNLNPIPGVKFTSSSTDPDQFLFYIYNTTPTVKETQTDSSGRGGFANVPPGLVTFTGYLADTGAKIGSTQVLVRAGYNTTLSILPSQQ